MPTYAIKSPNVFTNPDLPQAENIILPASNILAWLGLGKGVVGQDNILLELTDQRTGENYRVANTPEARKATKNGLTYFDFSAAASNRGYLIGSNAPFGALDGMTIVSVARPGPFFNGQPQMLAYAVTNVELFQLSFEPPGNIYLSAGRGSGGTMVARLPFDLASYPIIIAEIDYTNNRLRITEGLSKQTTGWVAGIPGASGSKSVAPNNLFLFGHSSNTTRNMRGQSGDMAFINRLMTDAEKNRAIKYLNAQRAALVTSG